MCHYVKKFVGVFAAFLLFTAGFSHYPTDAIAGSDSGSDRSARQRKQNPRVSPTERIHRADRKPKSDRSAPRPLDGYGNNRGDPEMNSAGTLLRRLMRNDYADGQSAMAGQARPGPRDISNVVFAQSGDRFNDKNATDFLWQWGQFLDHDIDLTDGIDPPESAPIGVPAGDPFFSNGLGMDFNRSIYARDKKGVRQQINEITGWIDASNVYGSDDERSVALRTMDGTGRLKTSPGNLLPNNLDGLPNAGGDSNMLFLAGDVRANEQVGLTAMHTLFVREHNRWAALFRDEANTRQTKQSGSSNSGKMYRFRDDEGHWVYSDRPPRGQQRADRQDIPGREPKRVESSQDDGDEIFEKARAMVAAEIQFITYSEFLPVLMGRNAIPRYQGYRGRTDARIGNEFSTAAFRFGHSMLSPVLLRLDENGDTIAAGNLPLRFGFFAPEQIRLYGIEPLLRGLSRQRAQDIDNQVIDDVRNFLFGAPGQGGFDLVSLNIQRGRDHGLSSYNEARRALGLTPATGFGDISSDPETAGRLQQAYADIEDVDLWVGGISEDNYRDSMLGELFFTILRDQFVRLRDGDRFWYANVLDSREKALVESLTLAEIIRLNTNIDGEIQDNVFVLNESGSSRRRRR